MYHHLPHSYVCVHRGVGPTDLTVAVLDRDIILPCHVSPVMSAENTELRWFHFNFSEAVFILLKPPEAEGGADGPVRRADLTGQGAPHAGEAAVCIHKVQVSDNGLYSYFFKKGGCYEEASLELKVAD